MRTTLPQRRPSLEGSTTHSLSSFACLGTTFRREEERREYFLERLREKLTDPEFRRADGFPHGTDQSILALSDPPWYAACPNPFLKNFITCYGKPFDPNQAYRRPPHTGDLRSSTRHAVYAFHPYHTKVPPEIIRTLIEHYTDPGDVILDGFCGSGMTGVAAREAGRHAILVDLCPVAGFISGVNCQSHDGCRAVQVLGEVTAASEEAWANLYQTEENGELLPVNYFVWSDAFRCPDCAGQFPFFPHGVVHHGNKVQTRAAFP